MKFGIAIDSWKLDIFKKNLDNAGLEFDQCVGVSPQTILLTVNAEIGQFDTLTEVICKSQNECFKSRIH